MMMIFPVANVICVELVLIVISLNSYKTTEAANFKNGKNFQNFVLNHGLIFEINRVSRIFCASSCVQDHSCLFFSLSPCKAKMSSPRKLMLTSDAGTYEEGWLNYNHTINGMCIDVGLSAFQCFFPVTKIWFHRTIWKFLVRDQFNCFTLRI